MKSERDVLHSCKVMLFITVVVFLAFLDFLLPFHIASLEEHYQQ